VNHDLKVKSVSESLLTPTLSAMYNKWNGSSDGMRSHSSQSSNDNIKRLNIAPVSAVEHFLTPTAATINASYKSSKMVEKIESKPGMVVENLIHF